ncbi:hypothetical protein Dimus_022433, partial [Dionaea muscipula]
EGLSSSAMVLKVKLDGCKGSAMPDLAVDGADLGSVEPDSSLKAADLGCPEVSITGSDPTTSVHVQGEEVGGRLESLVVGDASEDPSSSAIGGQ